MALFLKWAETHRQRNEHKLYGAFLDQVPRSICCLQPLTPQLLNQFLQFRLIEIVFIDLGL
jgi:hypothetical protein